MRTNKHKKEILDRAAEADKHPVGSKHYHEHNHAVHDKIWELRKIDPKAAQEVIADLMEMRTGNR